MASLAGRHFDAVVFDLDQTLVDSSADLATVWATWLAEFDVVPEQGRNWGGWTSEAIIRLCLPEADVARGLARMEELEVATTSHVTALPGAVEALAVLPRHRVAVGTSGSDEVARARLRAAGLREPDVLVTASDVTHGKPDPEVFLTAARRLGVDPAQCLVVEDAPVGVAAARAGGMASLAVLTSSSRDELRDADAVVTDLSQVRWVVDGEGIGLLLRP